jgi:hypothetical protein
VLVLAAYGYFRSGSRRDGFLLLRFGGGRVRPLDRLQSPGPVVSPFLPSPALVWKELVTWAGSLVPATPKTCRY